MGDVRPSMAGPKRPQDRVLLEDVQRNFHDNLGPLIRDRRPAEGRAVAKFETEGGDQEQARHLAARPISRIRLDDGEHELTDGSVVIAAITS